MLNCSCPIRVKLGPYSFTNPHIFLFKLFSLHCAVLTSLSIFCLVIMISEDDDDNHDGLFFLRPFGLQSQSQYLFLKHNMFQPCSPDHMLCMTIMKSTMMKQSK